jgi:Uma2 family endonuclease
MVHQGYSGGTPAQAPPMNLRTDIRMDKDAFYRWLERQERRFELVDGRPVMMNGVTRAHAKIATNLVTALGRLDRLRFDLVTADFAVEIGENIRYPDLMVSHPETNDARHADRPIFLVEILSQSSLYIDLHDKAAEYLSLPTVETYAVLSQQEAKAWVWTRAKDGMPASPEEVFGLDRTLVVPALGLAIPLTDIYLGVSLDA